MKLKIYFFDRFGRFILLSALDDTSGWVLEETIKGRSEYMRRVALSLVMMSGLSVANAMESPLTEMNGSPVNRLGASSKSSENVSTVRTTSVIESPPFLVLNASIPSQEEEDQKETLLEMAERGMESYSKKDPSLYRTASFYFTTIVQQKDDVKMVNPRSVALAHLHLGKMALRGEVNLCPEDETRGLKIAYQYLKNAAYQNVDPRIAAQAQIAIARIDYMWGSSKQSKNVLQNAVLGCEKVVKESQDPESVLTAKLLLSEAAQLGNGTKRDVNVAFRYADEVANEKRYPRESLKGCLQCASLYMEGIESDSWNFQHSSYAEAYLTRPRLQSQFEDLRLKAETLYQKLQAKVQECRYREGLAYIRQALPVNGFQGASNFWDRLLATKNIKTLRELEVGYPADYKHAIAQAEYLFEQAAYDDSNPEIKDAARAKLGLIYKVTGRPNKFEEFEKARQKAIQAAATNQ
jgi:hypothetical protein